MSLLRDLFFRAPFTFVMQGLLLYTVPRISLTVAALSNHHLDDSKSRHLLAAMNDTQEHTFKCTQHDHLMAKPMPSASKWHGASVCRWTDLQINFSPPEFGLLSLNDMVFAMLSTLSPVFQGVREGLPGERQVQRIRTWPNAGG